MKRKLTQKVLDSIGLLRLAALVSFALHQYQVAEAPGSQQPSGSVAPLY